MAAAEPLATTSEQANQDDQANPNLEGDEEIEIVEGDDTTSEASPKQQQQQRSKEPSRRKAPLAPSTKPTSDTVAELLTHLDDKQTTDFLRSVIDEYDKHLSALSLYNKQVSRTINGLKITWTPNKSAGVFTATTPKGQSVNGRGAIMEVIRTHVMEFSDYDVAQLMQNGLHVIVTQREAADPIVKRALMVAGTNLQQEEHFITAPLIATPEGGKTFKEMSNAEIKSVLLQAQAEDNEREVKRRTAIAIAEARTILKTETASLKRKHTDLEDREAAVCESEAKAAAQRAEVEADRKEIEGRKQKWLQLMKSQAELYGEMTA